MRLKLAAPQTTPEQVALTLVHEGTHARLLRAGFKYDETVRARIEHVCILTEILVARRLPASDELVAAASRRLARPTEFWSNAAFRARDLEQLAQLGPAARSAGRIAGWVARLWRWSRAA